MGCCNSKTKEPKKPESPMTREKRPTEKKTTPQATPAAATPIEDTRDVEEVAQAAEAPLPDERRRAIAEMRTRPSAYHCADAADDELKPCFEEGLAYRIVKGDTWYFYNDTLDQELHVDYRLGPGSAVTPGERTTMTTTEDGWQQAHMVVYPLETAEYFTGKVNGYKSSVSLQGLSEEYLAAQAEEADKTVGRELRAVEELVGNETDEESILRQCVATNTPYVDIHFVPDQMQMSRPGVDARMLPTAAMQRPTQYLPEDQREGTDAIRGAVVAESIERGKLGDCWLMCSAAVLAESETAVPNIFREAKPEEKAVGAYRVVLCKNGWWRSTIIDNYFPTVARHPLFASSSDDPRELWVSLYQKAYAKVHGSYASITGGDALQAIQDFTGAPTFRFDKEWEAAANDSTAGDALVQSLKAHLAAGRVLVLSTPSQSSTTYLSDLREADPETFKAIFAKAGLQLGYTYVVESIDGDGVSNAYFKLRNPWRGKADLLAGTFGSSKDQGEQEAFERTAEEGCVWMPWNDLVNYFDGGGLVYSRDPTTHYRVKSTFNDVQPSTVMQVRVTEPVTVQLVLSQPDKRGFPIKTPEARYAPIMLSVSKPDAPGSTKHRVHQSTSSDPSKPSETTYNFAVARDVAMEYTFLPNEGPYLVVPRIHRKGVQVAYDRPYVVGIIAGESLEGKMSIELKQVDKENRVFKNILTFPADGLQTVQADWQVYSAGALPQTQNSATVLSLPDDKQAVSPVPSSSSHRSSSHGAPSDHAEDASVDDVDVEEAPVAAVSDDDVEVQNRAVPDAMVADAADEDAAAAQAPTPIADDMPSAPVASDSDDDSDELSTPKPKKTPTPSDAELSTPKEKAPSTKPTTPPSSDEELSTPKQKTPSSKKSTPKSPEAAEAEAPTAAAPAESSPGRASAGRFAALRVSDSDSDSEL